ncbi:hypothetical protein HPB50_019074 [Hyalomma asiaticum]|uniref:Uncharacterized protein n=1 Tax=Hyalomma asiaticum TaxID=266040 RepID=A0ACB7RJK6_HYAAI|nr:hypothetical protein HPB50_019074 [Hyalomma asiaticum]
MGVRSYNEELTYLEKMTPVSWRIKKGFVPNMKVEGIFYVNNLLEKLMFEELRNSCRPGNVGGFLPGVKQIGNVAALPGIVGHSIGLPDIHSGYGFAIGNMAAFDMDDPKAIVSPVGLHSAPEYIPSVARWHALMLWEAQPNMRRHTRGAEINISYGTSAWIMPPVPSAKDSK